MVLSLDDLREIYAALSAARSDLWQMARVAEYNLTGRDPNYPSDAGVPEPRPPRFVHREGLSITYKVHDQVCNALQKLAPLVR